MMEQDQYIGQQFGNYRLVQQLDCGNFGCVYRAEHIYLKNNTVAIKVLHAHLTSQQKIQGFLQEANLLAMLKHPHILPILDVGIQNGFPYMVMEYCSAGSLRQRLKRQRPHPLPVEEALTILNQVGQALAYVHQHQVVHRDLKPENILFNAKGEALLADFGIAKMLATIGVQQGTITGTPAYMAPEQFRGLASREGDQYALGCIAYELLTGQKPFIASDMVSMMYKHLSEQPVAPRNLNPHLPAHMEHTILTAMAKEREARYADVATFLASFQKSAQQWIDEGNSFYRRKRYEEALAAYEQAIRLDPNSAYTYINKGNTLDDLKRYEEALTAYEQAIRLDSNDATAYNNKSVALGNLKRYEEALVALEQAIRLDPNDADAYINKGNALVELKGNQEALVALEQAIRLDPNDAIAYNNKGVALGNLKRNQEALAAYEQAIRLDPNIAVAYNNKGLTLDFLGRKREAQQAYERAKQLGYGN